ncbi:MAG: N-acetylmuramoyl-L-alanine amidase [Clostridia bacterium]|nr:N-acetylmuramoyl-L-alanine amidase [Clostridia bacterium]
MKKSKRTLLPRRKAEHLLTMSAALIVLFGGLAVVSLRRNVTNTSSLTAAASPAPKPLAGLVILVDPGHGGYDGGARCRDSGVWEKALTLSVSRKVEEALTQRGARVVMTRTSDTDLCTPDRPASLTKKRQDMQNRIAIATTNEVDLLLSIHMNEYRMRTESGPQVFYRQGCEGGRLLAGCLQEALITHLQPVKRRVAMAGDYFILQLEIPSALVECGFISNPAEEKQLLDPAYQTRLAEAIAGGTEEFVRLSHAAKKEDGSGPSP